MYSGGGFYTGRVSSVLHIIGNEFQAFTCSFSWAYSGYGGVLCDDVCSAYLSKARKDILLPAKNDFWNLIKNGDALCLEIKLPIW